MPINSQNLLKILGKSNKFERNSALFLSKGPIYRFIIFN